jgi:hypothetical protein
MNRSRSRCRPAATFLPALDELGPRLTPSVDFTAQPAFAAGTDPVAAVAADLIGDGKPDLVFANNISATVAVLRNTTATGGGTVSFAARQTFTVGSHPSAVAVADFNGDGRPDLAVVNYSDNTISVLLNTTAARAGTISFAAGLVFGVGNGPFSVAMGDFNGDDKPDLAIANFNGDSVSVLRNTTATGAGTVSFADQQTFVAGSYPSAVVVGDFNGDGKLDLAVADSGGNTLSVLRNTTMTGTSTVSFAAQQTFAAGAGSDYLATADFNGDGRPDLAVIDSNGATANGMVTVLLNATTTGTATVAFAAPQTFAVGNYPVSIAAADFNSDGRPDLAVVNYGDNTVSVLVNTTALGATTPAFAAQQTFAVGASSDSMAAADFNGDGWADLALSSGNNSAEVQVNTTTPFSRTDPVVVGQFGSQGVWRYDRTAGTWTQLTAANAALLAVDPAGDVAATFKSYGVWLYRPAAGWKQIGTADAAALAMDVNGDVVGSFPGAGVWLYQPATGFRQIGTGDAVALAMDGHGDVIGSFPGHGIWEYLPATGFQQIGTGDAAALTMDYSGDVAGSFPGAGVWFYRPTTGWKQLGTGDAAVLAMDGAGDVVGSFAGHGVWEYHPATGFQEIGNSDAATLNMSYYGDVFGSFAGYGIWEFDPLHGWFQRSASDAEVLAAV